MNNRIVTAIVLSMASLAFSQTTQPTTQPTIAPADQLLNQMLRTGGNNPRPLQPIVDAPAMDRTSGAAAVAPGAASLSVMREGSFIIDRVGRMTKSADGHSQEFTFDSDGKSMQDPPLVILPNLKLMAMENAVKGSNRDLRFRVTGMLTEYNGRNYVLLEKVLVVPDN